MKKYSLLYISLGLLIIMAGLHFIAITLYFYWTVWWFDTLMHTLAGFIGSLIAVWFFFDSGLFFKSHPTNLQAIIIGVVCILIVGVAWEIFEYINDLTQSTEESYTLDTTGDLVADFTGAILAGIIGAKKIFRSGNQLET